MPTIEASTADVTPHRPRRRLRVLGVLVAAALVVGGVTALVLLNSGDDEATPGPTESVGPDADQVAAAQEAALVYNEWRWRAEMAACLREAGYEAEGSLQDEADRASRVALFLGVQPGITNSDRPTAGMRSVWYPNPPLDDERLTDLVTDTHPDTCITPRPVVDTADPDAVAALVAEAQQSSTFLTVLAEYAWAAENPEAYLLALARGVVAEPATNDDGAAQGTWLAALAVVGDVVNRDGAWFVTSRQATDQYADSAGQLSDGSVVVVRAGEQAPVEAFGNYFWTPHVVECGGIWITWTKDGIGGGAHIDGFDGLHDRICAELAAAGAID